VTVKEAAWQVMAAAYLKASDQGRLPANARQIMYAARPWIIELTGKAKPWASAATFTQHLLPDFIAAHPRLTVDWDVVFDARGHFQEPHTGRLFGIGTLEVRRELASWERELVFGGMEGLLRHDIATTGPYHRYTHALFIEKEGFNPLLEAAHMQQRFDVALMSTKGMTVTAARADRSALPGGGDDSRGP
jgi:hypothetical protein